MRVAISHARPDPANPFRYIGGDVGVDFVNTADWTADGLDRFCSYDRVLEWAGGACVLTSAQSDSLRAAAATDPVAASCALLDAIELRGLLEQLFFDFATGESSVPEIAQLNERWLGGLVPPRLVVGSGSAGSLTLGWPHPDRELEYPLWVAAWSAAQLITSPDAALIKRCGGVDCGWYYVDRSRNGLRRWCEMETCGTVMKSRRRAERIAALRAHRSPDAFAQESPNRSSPAR